MIDVLALDMLTRILKLCWELSLTAKYAIRLNKLGTITDTYGTPFLLQI